MTTPRHSEAAFETVIEHHLLGHGYGAVSRDGFDRERAIFPSVVLDFIKDTQPKEWAKLEALHGTKTGEQILTDLCKWMDANGSLATLRHGFKCYGRTLFVAYFKAAHELNPELEERYAKNRLGVTRQLRFSTRSEKSLDVTLSVNGIPIATLELENAMTGQTVEDARRQYKQDRDPRETIFEFKKRTLVHFAVDTDAVLMTTRLAGSATQFLPFNKGDGGGAGNPADPQGRSYRTAYLWEVVLARDSLLDLLARFLHLQVDEKRDDQGRKVKTEQMVFPRYHQLQAVRFLVESARTEGPGHNSLVEHSAGSGKSNTIAWLTHRLASLHDEGNRRVFDSVIVVTDRVVLDQQLQDNIYQFEHKRGVVQKIDESSRQLAEALESAVPIIITTLQKFPFVSRQLLKMAEERGEAGAGTLQTRRCAVVIDEAHSSQGGETATDLKEVLGGEALRKEAQRQAAEEGREDLEELFRSIAKRGRQANLSFFAFTATPKHKTLAVFGRSGKPAHRYTMRQVFGWQTLWQEGEAARSAEWRRHTRCAGGAGRTRSRSAERRSARRRERHRAGPARRQPLRARVTRFTQRSQARDQVSFPLPGRGLCARRQRERAGARAGASPRHPRLLFWHDRERKDRLGHGAGGRGAARGRAGADHRRQGRPAKSPALVPSPRSARDRALGRTSPERCAQHGRTRGGAQRATCAWALAVESRRSGAGGLRAQEHPACDHTRLLCGRAPRALVARAPLGALGHRP
jgi:hypothetical protein